VTLKTGVGFSRRRIADDRRETVARRDSVLNGRPIPSGLLGAAAVVVALAALLLWLSMLASPYRLATGLLEGRRYLPAAERALSKGSVEAARYQTLAAVAAAERARAGLSDPSPLLDVAGAVPPIGRVLKEADHIVRAMELSADAAAGTLSVAEDALRGGLIRRDPDDPAKSSSVDMARLDRAVETISRVGDSARAAAQELRMIEPSNLPPRAQRAVARALIDARDAVTRISRAEEGFALLPTVLGADHPQTYLLGFQNPAEQRGTGGAILQFKILRMDGGRITIGDIEGEKGKGSVYNIDKDRRTYDIPLPGNAWMVQGIEDAQRFGNANWSPHWPLSARLMLSYAYKSAREVEKLEVPTFDGFIVVDPLAVEKMMSAIGPFTTGKSGHRITKENIVRFVLYQAYGEFPLAQKRRSVLAQIVNRFFSKALASPRPEELARSMGKALSDKNVQIWMKDGAVQRYIEQMNWDGEIERARRSDYLSVVEQNVGGNKLDYFDTHTNTVDVEIRGRDSFVSTEMRVHNGVFTPQPKWIMGDAGPMHIPMLNLYVPRRAELKSWAVGGERVDTPTPAEWTSGAPPEHFEFGKKVWSATLMIPPAQDGAVTFDYRVPGVVRRQGDRNVYRLVVQSQRKVHPETLTIRLSLPEGALDIEAPGFRRDGDSLVWSRPLLRDVVFEVGWRN
jgi:hypothetical protein